MQGYKHVIHNPENPSSELEAAKGWILQGNLLPVFDGTKDKADRAEKKIRFKPSIAELLNRVQLQIGLQNIMRHIFVSFVHQQHPPPRLCHTAAAEVSRAAKASAAPP